VHVPVPPERPSGGRYWQHGYEIPEGVTLPVGLALHSAGAATLNYGVVPNIGGHWRSLQRLNETEQSALSAITWGATHAEAVQVVVGCTLDEAHVAARDLGAYGLVSGDGGVLRPQFPVFTDAEDRVLAPVIDDVADEVWQEALWPRLSGLGVMLEEWGYGHLIDQLPITLAATATMATGAAVEEMLDSGVLPPVPDPPPPGFGYLAWEANSLLLSWGH
jgi:hypothetical protein